MASVTGDPATPRRGGRFGGHSLEPIHGPEHVASLHEEPLAGRSEHHPPARPLEQAHAELVLQLADALRQGRRGELQPGRGAAEVALLGDGHEVAQPSEINPATHSHNVIDCDMICVRVGRGQVGRGPR